MPASYVVTGGGRGVGRGIVERLLRAGGSVAVVELDPGAVAWTRDHAAGERLTAVVGDAGDGAVGRRAAAAAEELAPLTGWVNNAAAFRDAFLHDADDGEVLALIERNLAPAVAGCAAAVRHLLDAGRPGAIVNVSSHQAQRAVAGALPYATAKAAIEGLTRAAAVDYGPRGIRTNAVALGSIATERSADQLATAAFEEQLVALHPVGRVGRPADFAAVVAFLLGDEAGFVNGAVVAVDGGRAALGQDPEARST